MHTLLWALQSLGALIYGASGSMKLFMFDTISADVPSFGALPKSAWLALGVVELVCAVGLVAPGLLHRQPRLTVLAASVLALESLLFIWVHIQYREPTATVLSALLGLVMAFVAYGRSAVRPLG